MRYNRLINEKIVELAEGDNRVQASIELARPGDLSAILSLLEKNDLPQVGLRDHITTTLVAREEGSVVGSVALELYGTAALLRSLAVEKTLRGKGLGERLTESALSLARQRGVKQIYLLTETASGFFARHGFRLIDRSEVPTAVQRSVEFTSACPMSASAMMLLLSDAEERG